MASTVIRLFILIAACGVLHVLGPTHRRFGETFYLSDLQYETLRLYLKWALALWAIIDFNALLNRWAENKWIWRNDTSGWHWRNEVAVVTGGSQGIGACVVKKLVSHGINCAVLDVVPLADTITQGVLLTPSRSLHKANTFRRPQTCPTL